MSFPATPLAIVLGAALASGPAFAAVTLQPGPEGKDAFVYAFEVPGTLGVPGIPAEINFDEVNVPDTALAPFGQTLGVAETTPFVNPSDPEFSNTVREHTTRSLVEFDLSDTGLTSSRVASGSFSLKGIGNLAPFSAPTPEFPIVVDIKRVLEAWDEQLVTWNTRPAVGEIVTSATMTGGMEELVFDVTGLVKDWLGDTGGNFGFELSQRGVVQTDTPSMFTPNDLFAVGLFASSDNGDASLRPSLTVSEVPLPAALPLMLGAGGMLAFVGRRRRGA